MTSLPPDAQSALEEEERCLKEVLDCLSEQLQYSSRKLANESRRARELTSQIVNTTREEDKALLASDEAVAHALSHKKAGDIQILRKQLEKPYFARFVLEEQQDGRTKEFEYRLGFHANPDCRIIDWRKAPISKLYYDYREGDEYCEEIQGVERRGRIRLRNAVDIEAKKLVKLSCRYGSFIKENGNWRVLDSRGFRAASHGTLPDVLALITKEQFRTITEEAKTAILIQGIAGSGKTTVALHRLAWLLHEENSSLKAERCVVVVLSKILKAYVQNFLPSIGVNGVPVLTFSEWTKPTIARAAPHLIDEDGEISRPADPAPLSIQRVLRSMALLTSIEKYQARIYAARLADLEKSVDWTAVPAGLKKIVDDARAAGKGAHYILRRLDEGVSRGLQNISPQHQLYSGLSDFKRRLTPAEKSPEEVLIEVLSRPEEVMQADETKLIDRQTLEQARERLARNCQNKVLDPAADALIVRLFELRTGGIVMPDGESGRHDHIVVDEVQDFSPVDLAVFIRAVKDMRELTLVGDVSQKIHETSEFPGWKKLAAHWNSRKAVSKYVSLTVSHRSTLPIMRLAEHVQGQPVATEGRPGRTPIWFRCRTESKGISEVIEWLGKALERYPNALTALLAPSMQEAKYALSLLEPNFGAVVRLGDDNSFSFEDGIIVTDVLHAKGLEFMNVLVWNPSAQSYPPNQLGRNLLYSAITRAEENLCLVTWKKPSPLLPPINSKLIRGIRIGEEED